jgi:WD40 repeat protein
MLQVIDNHWKEHLRAMDNLEGGIDMRSFGTTQMVEEATQGVASLLVGGIAGALVRRNRPLADFREKATALFDEMTRQINEETVSHLFHLEVNSQSEEEDEAEKEDEDEEDEEEDEDDEDEEDEESVSERPGFVSQAATASPVLPQPAAQINPANKPPYLCRANSAPGEPSEMRGDEQLRGRKAGFLGGHLKRTLSGHSGRVRWLMMSPDCRQVSSGSDDRTIRVWDIGTGKCTRIIDPPNFLSELAISSDGHRLMAECGNCNFSDEHWLAVWETSTGKLTKFVKAFKNEDVIAMSADSLTTLSAGVFEPIRLWDVMGGKCLQTLEGKWCHTNYGAFVADGSWVITADDKIKLWEVKSGKCRKAITGHGPLSISTDGALVAFTGQDYNTIRIWNIVEDVPVSTLMGHTGQVMSVVLSLDQRWVLSGSEERNSATKDGMVRLWEVSSGACLATFEGRIANMGVVALSPDACLALASDEDHTIRVWELRWDWEFPASEDWDEGARPHLVNFLTLHTPFVSTDPDSREFLVRRGRPSWQESEQRLLLRSLQCAGYGWLKPEGVIRELEQMAADWEAPPPSPWEERN